MKKNICALMLAALLAFGLSTACQRERFWSVPVYQPSGPRLAPPWIDDFDHGDSSHNLLLNPGPCATGTYDGPTTSRPLGYAVHDGLAMKIGVSENTNSRWFGFYSAMDSTPSPNTLGLDVSSYTAVSLLIRGSMENNPTGGGLFFSLRAVNTPVGKETNRAVTRYLPSGVSSVWQTVVLPFRDYSQATNWSLRMAVFTISFKDLSGQPSNGVIWIDDLRFLP